MSELSVGEREGAKMTENELVLSIVSKYKRSSLDFNVSIFLYSVLFPKLEKWAGDNLVSKPEFSGSHAKGTATIFGSDVDIFVPLKNKDGNTLESYYNGLYDALSDYNPRKQNVSIRVTYNGHDIDVVPGRAIDGYRDYFTLYKFKSKTWTLTNISANIKLVKESGRINEIIAMKIWRYRNNLDISSTLLELIVIEALKNQRKDNVASNVITVLSFLRDEIETIRIVDPSNTNNILSNDLTSSEKINIANKAKKSAEAKYWGDVIW